MPLKRHPALQDLSRDHHLFLLEARDIRWFLNDHERAKPLQDVIESVITFWQTDGQWHLQEEEKIIYPYYLEHAPLKKRTIDAMMTDHNWMREKLTELEALPRFENTRPLLTSLTDYIVNHVRHEERVIYEAIQETLSEAQLKIIAERSRAFRQANRKPEAIGRAQDHLDVDTSTE